MEKDNNEEYNSMVNTNTMLLSFEGWIKYIEGFSRGLQTTKTVDAGTVFDCIGEIMEYMKSLKGQIVDLLLHCEEILETKEKCDGKIKKFEKDLQELIAENTDLTSQNDALQQELGKVTEENNKLRQAIKMIEEKEKKNG